MAPSRKVYDFPIEKTTKTLVTAFKKRRNESTVADLIGSTGLPKFQVEESLKHVLAEYDGHMKVTESGEILYYFPAGMRSTVKGFVPKLKKTLRNILSVTGRVLSFLFKIWIMVMLVGYFVVFIALLLLAIFASIAGSMSSRDDNRGRSRGGFGSFYLTTRVIELFLQIWLYSGMRRQDERLGYAKKRPTRPLHKSVFAFVFGEGDPNAGWDETEKKTVIRFIQSHKGVITGAEFMTLTGRKPQEAELLMNRYLLEFEGEPDVTEDGTLIYRFPELMRTRETVQSVPVSGSPRKELIPFNRNIGSANKWIGALNSVNLLFGSFFLYYSFFVEQFSPARVLDRFYLISGQLLANIGDPWSILAYGLGMVPFVFSVLFYAVPAVRRWNERRKNEEIKQENFRKKLFTHILEKPEQVNPAVVEPAGPVETPANIAEFRDRTMKELGAAKGVEVEELGKDIYEYSFPELARETRDVEAYRKKVDLSKFSLGDTVFDSGE